MTQIGRAECEVLDNSRAQGGSGLLIRTTAYLLAVEMQTNIWKARRLMSFLPIGGPKPKGM